MSALARRLWVVAAVLCLSHPGSWCAQKQPPSERVQAIIEQLRNLRQLPDDVRARTTRQLALEIRQLPAADPKAGPASSLASLATEGDFGHDVLQQVATTLADALREQPEPAHQGQPAPSYIELAQLVRYEHVEASLSDAQFSGAMARLESDDRERQQPDFTLADLRGNKWTLKDLRGKTVLVNFWATWCPPCRKEMPDLQTLYDRFKDQGLIVLAISDEDADKVKPFVEERHVTYPVLLDPGRKVNELFRIEGIPKSFVYDPTGKLVAEAIDMRTENQFLAMLGHAGLH